MCAKMTYMVHEQESYQNLYVCVNSPEIHALPHRPPSIELHTTIHVVFTTTVNHSPRKPTAPKMSL